MKEYRLVKNSVRCIKCGDVIESKSCHDFKYCSCKSVAVDGGLEYCKRLGNLEDMEELSLYMEYDLEQEYLQREMERKYSVFKDQYSFLIHYDSSFKLLDAYDHQCVPRGDIFRKELYCLNYEDCLELIDFMRNHTKSDIFGKQRADEPLRRIVESIYHTIDGKDVYRSVPEKAANLLYFLIKDHPFIDGCKRIGAAIFLYYLQKNDSMWREEYNREKELILQEAAVTAMVLLIAHSLPAEKELIIRLIVQFIIH